MEIGNGPAAVIPAPIKREGKLSSWYILSGGLKSLFRCERNGKASQAAGRVRRPAAMGFLSVDAGYLGIKETGCSP